MSFLWRGGGMEQRLYPRRLRRSSVEEIGEARVSFGEDGIVEACDPHGCSRVRAPSSVEEVLLEPVAPFNRPQRLTGCIFVEFSEPVVYPGRAVRRLWFLAPYEVAVVAGGTVVAYVSPTRAKFTLVGDIVGGNVCRYYRSPVAEEPEGLSRGPGLAYTAVEVNGEPLLLSGVGFYAVGLPLFTDEQARLYYPRLEAVARASFLEVKATQEPPVDGLSLAQRGRKITLLAPVFSVPAPRP